MLTALDEDDMSALELSPGAPKHGAPAPLPDPCPGILNLPQARDGLLARVRVPGGTLAAAQLRACAELAETCGHGVMDITSRANLQIRGLSDRTAGTFAEGIRAAGLLLSAEHERVRNIVASPLAGIDPDELLDTRPIVQALDAALQADPALAALPAKFGFVLDGGGLAVGAFTQDVGLVAVRDNRRTTPGVESALSRPAAGLHGAGGRMTDELRSWGGAPTPVLFVLVLGGAATDIAVYPADATVLAIAAARAFLRRRDDDTRVRRMRDLTRDPVRRELIIAEIRQQVPSARRFAGSLALRPAPRIGPLGMLPQALDGAVACAPVVPFGRLTGRQAPGLAQIADEHGAEIRLTPWRGVLLAGIAGQATETVTAEIEALGLPLAPTDPYAGLVACAGLYGCASALADVRQDAAAFAAHLAHHAPPEDRAIFDGDRVVAAHPPLAYWAGCGKRCGMRDRSDLLAVAATEGYELHAAGVLVASGLDSTAVVEAATRIARERLRESGQ
jgi:precorrin-3B synthase